MEFIFYSVLALIFAGAAVGILAPRSESGADVVNAAGTHGFTGDRPVRISGRGANGSYFRIESNAGLPAAANNVPPPPPGGMIQTINFNGVPVAVPAAPGPAPAAPLFGAP